MKAEKRFASGNRCRVVIVAFHAIAIFLFVFPSEAFYLSKKHQAFPVTSSLFLQEDNQNDSPIETQEQSKRPSLRRYQGGMIRPVVIAAKPEPTSDFVKVNGQDAPKIYRKEGTGSSGMFRPNVRKMEIDETVNSPQPLPVDESTTTTTYITGGLIGVQAERGIESRDDEIKDEKQVEMKEVTNEAAIELDPLVEVEPKKIIQAETEESLTTKVESDETNEIEQHFESSQETTEESDEFLEEDFKTINDTGEEIQEKEGTTIHADVEHAGDEEIDSEAITDVNSEAEYIEPPYPDVSALQKEENEKLKAIQEKILVRKQQQVELEKIEEELLQKTEEIKMRKKELLQLEGELALTKCATENDDGVSDDLPEKGTNQEIPYYSPKEYSALPQEEKLKLREARAAIRNSGENTSEGKTRAHPHSNILGPVIADLGYKRVHVVSSGRLGTIPIWKKQRTYKYGRVKGMAAEKEEQMHLGFPGIICLYEDTEGKLSIIDGQHRVGMMQAIRESRKKLKLRELDDKPEGENEKIWNEQETFFQNVLVEVYSESSTANAINQGNDTDADYRMQIFQEINKAKPYAGPILND